MKKAIVLGLVFISILVSCKKEKAIEVVPVTPEKEAVEETVSEECYSGTIKKDTILMQLKISGNQVITGELSYNFYEKDKNEGTLVGQLRGDTLIADYTFMSEGITSVRQVAFLKKEGSYVGGFGDVIDDNNGKVRFKDINQLNFEGQPILSKVDCNR